MKTIMFFGDSITDCGRDYKDWNSLGFGFPLLRFDPDRPHPPAPGPVKPIKY